MEEERKAEEFEDNRKKWKIWFDVSESPMGHSDSLISVRFRKNRKEHLYLTENDIKNLKQDLKDLGKFRIIKQGRGFLER